MSKFSFFLTGLVSAIPLLLGGVEVTATEVVVVGGSSPTGAPFIGLIDNGTFQELYYGDAKNRTNGLAYSKECNTAVAVGDWIDVYDFNRHEGERANVYLSARLWDVDVATINGKSIFVAVGNKTNVVSSTDCGKTWKQAIPFTEENKQGGSENIQKYRDAVQALKTDVFSGDFAAGFTHYRGVSFVEDKNGGGKFVATGSFDNVTTLKLDADNYARFESFTKHTKSNSDQAKDIVSIGNGSYLITGKTTYQCDIDNKCKKVRKLSKYDFESGLSDENTTVLGGNFNQISYKKPDDKNWQIAKVNGRPNVIWNIRNCSGQYYAAVHTPGQLLVSGDGTEWNMVQLSHHEDNEEDYQMIIKGVACAIIE